MEGEQSAVHWSSGESHSNRQWACTGQVKQENRPLDVAAQVTGDLGKGASDGAVEEKSLQECKWRRGA